MSARRNSIAKCRAHIFWDGLLQFSFRQRGHPADRYDLFEPARKPSPGLSPREQPQSMQCYYHRQLRLFAGTSRGRNSQTHGARQLLSQDRAPAPGEKRDQAWCRAHPAIFLHSSPSPRQCRQWHARSWSGALDAAASSFAESHTCNVALNADDRENP
jgi:hypothetical protein